MSHPYVQLALDAIRHYLQRERYLDEPKPLPEDLGRAGGAFVSLKEKGQLRGCVGTIHPLEANLAREIIHNAVSAAVRDPRFSPVTADELENLVVSVDVLTPLEKVPPPEKKHLDCKKYGLVVRHGDRQGVLLPDIEGVDTVEDQIRICKRKAGIGEKEGVEYYRFEVIRYK